MPSPANRRFAIPPATAIGVVLANLCAGAAVAHGHPLQPIQSVRATAAWSPDAPGETAYDKGKRLLAAGDAARALAAFQQALASSPKSADALNGVAVTYDRLGRMDLAEPFYAAALSIDPTAFDVENNLGYSLYLSGRYADAIPHLRLAATGGDPDAAAASKRTLASIEAWRDAPSQPPTDAAAAAPRIEPSAASVERTSEGEQRLVIEGSAGKAGGTMADEESALAAVAPRWTSEDDRMLLAEVSAEELEDARAARSEPKMTAGSKLESSAPVDTDLAHFELRAPDDRRSKMFREVGLEDAVLANGPAAWRTLTSEESGVVTRPHETSDAAVLGARRFEFRVSREAQTQRRHGNDDPFDSDDPVLNAFAARMRAAGDHDLREVRS